MVTSASCCLQGVRFQEAGPCRTYAGTGSRLVLTRLEHLRCSLPVPAWVLRMLASRCGAAVVRIALGYRARYTTATTILRHAGESIVTTDVRQG